ncbi:MAG: YybS family protein [Thermoanaerobaculales bacterium]|nr:YybS family protein [Thermoanaerobaculales bacterium]
MEERQEHEEHGLSAPPQNRLPVLGPMVSGLLSLFLAGSLVILAPIGLLIAPLAVIPVLRHAGDGKGAMQVWAPVTGLLVVLAFSGVGPLALAVLAAYLLVVVLPTLSVEVWRRAGWSEGRWIAVTVLLFTILLVGVGVFATAPNGPVETIIDWARQVAVDAEELYSALGMSRGELQRAMDQAEILVGWTLPGMIVAYLVALLFWLRPRIPILGFDLPVGSFEDYRSDEWLPVVFVVAGLSTVLLTGAGRWAALNVLLVVLSLYFVHGLAIIRAHLARWIGRGWLVRWGVLILALQMPLPAVVAMLGMVDAFRPLRPQPNEDGGQ